LETIHTRIIVERGVVFVVQLQFDRSERELFVEFNGSTT
jgi:hypothetical protein